jgi:outer membrane beta-barrel protein
MSIEDFGSDLVYGVKLAYHVTEGFFVEGSVGRTEGGLTSFEVLSGGAPLLTDSERELTYYNLNVGYNILPGEGFIGEGRAYNTAFYVIAGLGSTSFAGDDRFTVNFGAGYRFLVTDSIALHIDFRDHTFLVRRKPHTTWRVLWACRCSSEAGFTVRRACHALFLENENECRSKITHFIALNVAAAGNCCAVWLQPY